MDMKIVTEYKMRIHNMIVSFCSSDEEEIRSSISKIIAAIMNKDLDNNYQHNFAKSAAGKLLEIEATNHPDEAKAYMDSMQLLIAQRSRFGDELIHILSDEPLTPYKLIMMKLVLFHLVPQWFNNFKHKKLLTQIFNAAINIAGSQEVLDAAIDCLKAAHKIITNDIDKDKWIDILQDFVIQPETSAAKSRSPRVVAYLKIATSMFNGVENGPYAKYSLQIYETIIGFIFNPAEEVANLIFEAIESIITSEAKENQHQY